MEIKKLQANSIDEIVALLKLNMVDQFIKLLENVIDEDLIKTMCENMSNDEFTLFSTKAVFLSTNGTLSGIMLKTDINDYIEDKPSGRLS